MLSRTMCVSLVVGVSASLSAAQPFITHFDAGIDGWTIETRTTPDGAFTLVNTYLPDHVSAGGDAGGYISEVDPDNQYSFFRAPSAWMGDRSSALGGYLRYSTRTDALTFADGRLVILFGNNGQKISHDAGLPPLNTWTRRDIPLAEGAWRIGTNASGALATEAQIGAILGDLEAMFIGMEFGADALEERVDLDRVGFGVCRADLTLDFELNFFDVQMFLSAFAAREMLADWNDDGVFNFFDVQAFLADLAGGC